MKTLLVNANALTIPLADNSVHCVITSPPYWGLRDYSTNGQLGLERTPEEYIARMVEVYREVRRVLHPEGVMFLNIGDSYAGSGRGTNDHREIDGLGGKPRTQYTGQKRDNGSNLKPKDLVGIPWRLAFALQADGWWLRSDIIWAKPNPMPESVTDRPTKSHEYIFLMTKSSKYFWDQEGVREKANYDGRKDTLMKGSEKYKNGVVPNQSARTLAVRGYERWPHKVDGEPGRNLRTVWTIATQPYSGAHYATYPEELVEKCVRAGTSERGCCPECGKQWRRVLKHVNGKHNRKASLDQRKRNEGIQNGGIDSTTLASGLQGHNETLGWQPSCTCFGHFETRKIQESWAARASGTHDEIKVYIPDKEVDPIPSIVFDPFIGSGTTSLVARRLGRRSIGLDLSLKYLTENARKRLSLDKLDAWTRAVK